MMKRSMRPTTSSAKRPKSLIVPDRFGSTAPTMYGLKTPSPIGISKNQPFKQSFSSVYENIISFINHNSFLIENSQDFTNLITDSDQQFFDFSNTLNRLCGNTPSLKQGRKPGLVSSAAAVKSVMVPFINTWQEICVQLHEYKRSIPRKILTAVERELSMVKDAVSNSKNEDPEISLEILQKVSDITASFETLFQSDDPANTQQYVVVHIRKLYDDLGNSINTEFASHVQTILLRQAKLAVLYSQDFHNIESAKEEFQKALDGILEKFEMNMEIPKAKTVSSITFIAPKFDKVYVHGQNIDEVIQNGARILEENNFAFFSDLRDGVKKLKENYQKEINNLEDQINAMRSLSVIQTSNPYKDCVMYFVNYLDVNDGISDEDTANNVRLTLSKLIKERDEFKKLNNQLNAELDEYKIAQTETDAIKTHNSNLKLELETHQNTFSNLNQKVQELTEENARLKTENAEQKERFTQFLSKMATVTAPEEENKEQKRAKKEERSKELAKAFEKDVCSRLSKALGSEFNTIDEAIVNVESALSEKVEFEKKTELNRQKLCQAMNISINSTFDQMIEKLTAEPPTFFSTIISKLGAMANLFVSDATLDFAMSLIETIENKINDQQKAIEANNQRMLKLRQRLDTILQISNGATRQAMLEIDDQIDAIESIITQRRSDVSMKSTDITKLMSTVLQTVNVTSTTDPRVYLPEISYYFMMMHHSTQVMKQFSTELDSLFARFEFKLPRRKDQRSSELREGALKVCAHLKSLEPQKIHSMIFHTLSRFVDLIDALSS